jgi:hypothetical protein
VKPSRTLTPDLAAELRFAPADLDLLKAIATATGGAFQPQPASLVAKAGERSTERQPLWPMLVGVALFLWFTDLLFRRIRVFE